MEPYIIINGTKINVTFHHLSDIPNSLLENYNFVNIPENCSNDTIAFINESFSKNNAKKWLDSKCYYLFFMINETNGITSTNMACIWNILTKEFNKVVIQLDISYYSLLNESSKMEIYYSSYNSLNDIFLFQFTIKFIQIVYVILTVLLLIVLVIKLWEKRIICYLFNLNNLLFPLLLMNVLRTIYFYIDPLYTKAIVDANIQKIFIIVFQPFSILFYLIFILYRNNIVKNKKKNAIGKKIYSISFIVIILILFILIILTEFESFYSWIFITIIFLLIHIFAIIYTIFINSSILTRVKKIEKKVGPEFYVEYFINIAGNIILIFSYIIRIFIRTQNAYWNAFAWLTYFLGNFLIDLSSIYMLFIFKK